MLEVLEKLEIEREALGGKVYDVLGRLFDQKALRDLLMEAVRYGNDPAVKARLDQAVDGAVDYEHLQHPILVVDRGGSDTSLARDPKEPPAIGFDGRSIISLYRSSAITKSWSSPV
jgi:hypothetical protein